MVLFLINEQFLQFADVIAHRISLMFLPAFIRVVALVVAGLAGAIGIVIGSLVIQIFYFDLDLMVSMPVSMASGLGVLAAYAVMRVAFGSGKLPITLPVLLALTGLYSAFNGMVHGLLWHFAGVGKGISAEELSLMMLGDFLGVIVMFFICRPLLRLWPEDAAWRPR